MSPTNAQMADGFSFMQSWARRSLMFGAAAAVLAILGAVLDRTQFLRSYLFAFIFWNGLALGCMGILLMHGVVGGKWGLPIRRLCEAGTRTLPYMALLLIPILLEIRTLYPWSAPGALNDPVIARKSAYLNVPFFILRTVVYYAIWLLYSRSLSRMSAQQDAVSDPALLRRIRRISAPGLLIFVMTATFAFIDWIMSLEPDWFSTIYGAMFLVGEVLEAFAFVIALAILLSRYSPLREVVTPQHLHDLGNLMFAFMVLWAYLSFSQYLIIWSGNLPDEISWYLNRLRGGWNLIAIALVVFHFAVPFLLLLQRGIKRRPQTLLGACIWILFARVLDVFWIVEPAFFGRHLHVSWMDAILPMAIGGLWLWLFFQQLRFRPLTPTWDPRLQGAPRETVAY